MASTLGNSGDYEQSISIDCIYENGLDNVRLGIFIEGLGYSWTVLADYGPSIPYQPSYLGGGSTNGSLTYFWMHKIA
jgi:hypothetical protein